MRKEAFDQEERLGALRKDIKTWKEKHKMEIEEKEFYHKQALDAKRKNKLLKVAISRLQIDREKNNKSMPVIPVQDAIEGSKQKGEFEKDTDTFLTGANIDEQPAEIEIDSIENS